MKKILWENIGGKTIAGIAINNVIELPHCILNNDCIDIVIPYNAVDECGWFDVEFKLPLKNKNLITKLVEDSKTPTTLAHSLLKLKKGVTK